MNRSIRTAGRLACAALICTAALSGCAGKSDGAPRTGHDKNARVDVEANHGETSDCRTSLTVVEKASGAETTLTDGGAVSLAGASAYTMYAADFPLDMSSASLAFKPDVPPDGHLATLAVTVFQPTQSPTPIKAGTMVPAGTQLHELVFVTTYATDSKRFGDNTDMAGSLTLREVGSSVCAEVDYADAEKSVSGTLAAPAVAVS